MGQQQLLLAILSVILVGIAIIVGINLFSASAAQSNLEAVTNDVLALGARAQQYYFKPVSMGGGGNSFEDLTIQDLTAKASNDNGTYSIEEAEDYEVKILGVCKFDGDGDGKNCEVEADVSVDEIEIEIEER